MPYKKPVRLLAVMAVVLASAAPGLAEDAAKEIKSTLQKARSRMMSTQIDQAVALFRDATTLLAKLKADDPGHKDLADLQKLHQKLATDLETKVTQRAGRALNPMQSALEKALAGDDPGLVRQYRDKLAAAVAEHIENLKAAGGSSGEALLAGAQEMLDEADAKLGGTPPEQERKPEKPAARPDKPAAKPEEASAPPSRPGLAAAPSGEDPKQIYNEIQRKFRGARGGETPDVLKLAEEIRGLIDRLRAADPGHNRLADFEKKVEQLVSEAYTRDVQNARNAIERCVSRIDMYLERNQEDEREQLEAQRKKLGEALETHRAALEAVGAEGRKLIETTEAKMRKVDEAIGAALAGDALAERWTARLSQYTRSGEKDLTSGVNNDADYDRTKKLRAEATRVWAEYEQVSFPDGKTSELERAERFFKESMEEADRQLKFVDDARADAARKEKEAGIGSAGTIVFSASPLDPADPSDLATRFTAPGHIYALMRMERTWGELLGKTRDGATVVELPIEMQIDGERTTFQYITTAKPEVVNGKFLALDIAPEPARMTAYKDSAIVFGEGAGDRRIGPDAFTYHLAQLAPGEHRVRIRVTHYSDVLAAGDFTIEGTDYQPYAALREQVLSVAAAHATMPPGRKTDKALEANMRELLENAGWTDIRRLIIVDKDWWLDRVSGGDSPIQSRHIAAAAAARGADGKFFWCKVTFHQQKLITGGFGPLELTHTGRKQPIEEKNIDK